MDDLYSEIRERSKQDYGQKFEEWAPRILVDQYSDRTHFIFELIQNAEDAGATYVTFSLYPDRLVLCHNESRLQKQISRAFAAFVLQRMSRSLVKLDDLVLDSSLSMPIRKRRGSILASILSGFAIWSFLMRKKMRQPGTIRF